MEDVTTTIGPYQGLRRIAVGGMGEVYEGWHNGVRVAIKTIRPEYVDQDPSFRARFRNEATAAASIRSPYVPRVFDVAPDAPRPWIAMEYIDGRTLADVIATDGPLP